MGADASELRAFAEALRAAAAEAAEKAAAVVRTSGFDLQREMVSQIDAMGAVDTGTLRASVSPTFAAGASAFTAEVGPTVDYAGYVHDGTYRMAGRPYADAAANIIEPNFVAAAEAIGKGIL